MKTRVFFNGRDLSSFSAYLADSNYLSSPAREVEKFSVPGRSGDLIAETGRFSNFVLTVSLYINKDFQKNADELKNWLNSCTGYCRYEETRYPDDFRMACFTAEFVPDLFDRKGGSVILTFDCKPQRWLKSGERSVKISESLSFRNKTRFTALPVIEVSGTGSFEIEGKTFTVTENTGTITIDSERQEIYEGTENRNSCVELYQYEFPELPVGNINVSVDGVSLNVRPRWWKI